MLKAFKVLGRGALAFALLLAVATQWLNPGAAAAAETERQVLIPVAMKHEPVVITKVTLGDTVVQAGRFVQEKATDPITGFQAGDAWIQNLTIYLLNRTHKTVAFAIIDLGFPETGDGRTKPQRAYQLNLGRIPPAADFDRSGEPLPQSPDRLPLSFAPGQTMALRLGDYIEQIRSHVEPVLPLSEGRHLTVSVSHLYFQDGMQWGTGMFAVPDRQNLSWRFMDRDYFPGDMDRNWPGRPGWAGH